MNEAREDDLFKNLFRTMVCRLIIAAYICLLSKFKSRRVMEDFTCNSDIILQNHFLK